MCNVSKDIGINREKEIHLSNQESTSGLRCERTNMAANVKCL